MKKWLIWCLTVLAVVCLIPGIALNAKAESLYCRYCDKFTDCEILGYEKFDSSFHTLHIKCKSCSKENDIIDARYSEHTDDGKTPTCTTGKTCALCGAEYGVLGHDWGAWTPNGNGTHTGSCTRCSEVKTASCTGGTATCTAKAVCEVCGGEHGEKDPDNHALVHHDAQAATCTEKGWDAYDTCSRCDYTTYAELPALNHDYQAVTVDPTCETDGYTVFTCSRCKDSYTADPTDKLGHQFGAWSPNGTGSQSADCLRQGCAHTGSTDCRKFTFRTAEGEMLTFCPVCGQAENAAQLEKIDAATAWALSGSLSAEDVTARTNGEYLSVAFETAGSLTQPTGRVRLALPAGLLEGKKLVRIDPDGTQTEMPFETERGKLIYTLDFANSALPVMLFRLVPQPTAL